MKESNLEFGIKIIILVSLILYIYYNISPKKSDIKEGLTQLDIDPNYKFTNSQENMALNDMKEYIGNNIQQQTAQSNNRQRNTNSNTNFNTNFNTNSNNNFNTNSNSDNLWNQYFDKLSTGLDVPVVSNEKYNSTDVEIFNKQYQKTNNQDTFDINSYIPKEINNDWFQQDLSNYPTLDQNKLIDISQDCIGINTVGNTLKNASWDIRGNIPCPKKNVGPFLNSSYDPDTNIRSLCG